MAAYAPSRPRPSGQRLHELILGMPVFVKVMGIALGIAALLSGGMLWQIHQAWHAHLRRDLRARGQIFAERVAAGCRDLARAGRDRDVTAQLGQYLGEFPDATYLMLQGRDGRILAEARADGSVGKAQIQELNVSAGAGGERLRAGISTARVDQEVRWLTLRLAGTTVIIALLGAAAAWWLARLFAHPIEELVVLTRAVKGGHYEAVAPVRTRDEVGELATAFNEMTQALAQKEAAHQQLLRKVIGAGEEERKRIARGLHDQTGQALTSQIAGLTALENQSRDPATRRRLSALRQQAEQTLMEVHDLSVTLRPSVLDDVGLMAALRRHCRLIGERAGIQATCAELGLTERRLPSEVELTIYRLIQEAIANAVRHGRAQQVRALVQRTETGVQATVQDNGCGFDTRDWQRRCMESDHLGLLGIEERVALLGGTFRIESKPGQGTTVRADIPLKESA